MDLKAKTKSQFLILGKGLASFLSLVLAFIYSKDLGLENRSIISVILLFSYLTCLILSTGLNISFRRIYSLNTEKKHIAEFVYSSLFMASATSILTSLLLIVYSRYKAEIPSNLLLLSFIYSFMASLDNSYFEGSITTKNVGMATKVEPLTIMIQLVCYIILTKLAFFSTASSLLISLITGYFISVYIYSKILTPVKYTKINNLLIHSFKSDFAHAIAFNLIDRLDRLIVSIFLPVSMLAKYAIATTAIGFLRYIPDLQTRLKMTNHHLGIDWMRLYKRKTIFYSLILLAVIIFVSLYYISTKALLGAEWLLSIPLVSLLALQELLRGYFGISSANYLVTVASKRKNINAFKFLTIFIILNIIAVNTIGAIGIPVAMLASYLISSVIIKHEYKQSAS